MFRLSTFFRSPFAVLGVVLVVAVLAFATVMLALHPNGARSATSIGGPFSLIDQNGRPVSDADLRGKPFMVFFGYTHCPDVCPTTLSDMTQVLDRLGKEQPVGAVFITIDPERDRPAVLKDYLSSFDSRILGLTGDPASIESVEKSYRVYAKKVPDPNGDYTMDHTAVVYLMDKAGRFVNALNLSQPPDAAAAELKGQL